MIKVIDAICGAGKSTKIFDVMRDGYLDEGYKYLYITPFLTEIDERIPKELPELNFKSPVNVGEGKIDSLKQLVQNGENVASTHVLFGMLTEEIVDILIQKKYRLVIDEAINCVGLLSKEYNVSDTKALIKSRMVLVDREQRNKLSWNEEEYPEHDGKYALIRRMCSMGMLYSYQDEFVMFEYPPKLLKSLEEVYVLTYLFNGSDMRCWLDLNQIGYTILDNEALGLRSEQEIKSVVKANLSFVSNRNLDNTRQRDGTLSKTWFKNANPEEVKKYKAMMRSCVVNEKAKAGDVFWTTYKDYESKLAGDGYRRGVNVDMPAYLPCNIRATNKYMDYRLCMYAVNLFKNPTEVNYLKGQGVEPDEDTFALSEAIQFIFRGAIRQGKPMSLLVLSKRVRKLLEDWIYDK
jgi:hypothetical protein